MLRAERMLKYWAVMLLGLVSQGVTAQCAVSASHDTVYACEGDTVYLWGNGADSFEWSGSTALNCTQCDSTYVVVGAQNQAIVLEGTGTATNMATNGNFSNGNTGFITNYTYNASSIWNEGTYAVGPNPNAVHPNFGSWGDHTTGTGNYMLVNGSTSGNTLLWRQTVQFAPGAQVTMTWWMLTFVTPAGSLRLKVNGANIGGLASTPASTGIWQQTTRTFTAPASGSCTISLFTQSSAVAGNDFGIDDICYTSTCTSYDTVHVMSAPISNHVLIPSDTAACDELCITWDNQSNLDSSQALYWMDFGDGQVDTSYHFSHCYDVVGDYMPTLYSQAIGGCAHASSLAPVSVYGTRRLSHWQWRDGLDPMMPLEVDTNAVITPMSGSLYVEWLFDAGAGLGDSLFVDVGDGQVMAFSLLELQTQQWLNVTYTDFDSKTVCAWIKTAEGCIDSICYDVHFTPEIDMPNVLTPNEDGLNDRVAPEWTAADHCHWIVRSRWGQIVFESTELQAEWDGTHRGRPVPDGVYFVIARAWNDDTPMVATAKGALTVIR